MFFIPKANASIVNTYTSIKYSQNNLAIQQEYKTEINLILDYVREHGINTYFPNNYVIGIDLNGFVNNDITVYMLQYISFSGNLFNTNTGGVSILTKNRYQHFSINNGVVTPVGTSSNVQKYYTWSYDLNDCNPDNENCTIYEDRYLFDSSGLTTSVNMTLSNITYQNPKNYGLSINGVDYDVGATNVPQKEFFASFVNDTNPNLCVVPSQIGETTNISSITFRVTGFTNSLDYPLEGFVDLISQDQLNLSNNVDWSTFVNVQVNEGPEFDEDVTVDYNVSYNYDTQTLHFYYNATTEDDIDSYVDVLFTLGYNDTLFKPFFTSRLYIFACQPYGGVLSYAYRDDTTGMTNSTDTTLLNFLGNASSSNWPGLFNFIKNYPKGPVDSILTMPLDILNSLLNKFSTNTCSPLVLNLPYVNRNITLPCINTLYSQINGLDVFLNWFSALFSALLLYKYFIFLYKWVDDVITFRENNHFGGI